jgi:hypothetical protein
LMMPITNIEVWSFASSCDFVGSRHRHVTVSKVVSGFRYLEENIRPLTHIFPLKSEKKNSRGGIIISITATSFGSAFQTLFSDHQPPWQRWRLPFAAVG